MPSRRHHLYGFLIRKSAVHSRLVRASSQSQVVDVAESRRGRARIGVRIVSERGEHVARRGVHSDLRRHVDSFRVVLLLNTLRRSIAEDVWIAMTFRWDQLVRVGQGLVELRV